MKIFDISIKNFRGIKSLTNLKVGEINSFVGKNDSGKSNILKALDLFLMRNLMQMMFSKELGMTKKQKSR